jgi:hypothetical protein
MAPYPKRVRYFLITALVVVALALRAQVPDTLLGELTMPVDSALEEQLAELDSIQQTANDELAALKGEYDSLSAGYESLGQRLQHQIDSLNRLKLPTRTLTAKLDSVSREKEEKLAALTRKAEDAKQSVKEKINNLNLPDEVNGPVNEYTRALDRLDISLPSTEFRLPGFSGKEIPNLALPNFKNPIPDDFGNLDLSRINSPSARIPKEVSGIPQDLPESLALEELAAKAEEKAGELAKEHLGDMTGAPTIPDEEAAREMIATEVKKQAADHFAGNHEQLKAAMDLMSKYKKKYPSVQSTKDLPKRVPNPMKGKPLRERLVPGISLQVQRRNDWWFDLNPYLGYRFTGRITAGLGWNQRIPYDFNTGQYNSNIIVYGPRAYGEFRLSNVLAPRLELECLNTPVRTPPDLAYDHREWVWSMMVGMKKDYRISKSLRGNAQVLYNVFDKHHKSPYIDRLNIRMGLELTLSKKPKTKL